MLRWRLGAVVAIATLAVGIGTATSLLVFLRAVLASQTPGIDDLDAVGRIYESSRSLGVERAPLAMDDVRSLIDTTSSFEVVAGYTSVDRALTIGATTVRRPVAAVTDGFFDLLRVRPSHGRLLSRDEARSREPVVVISDSLWRKYLPGSLPGETTLEIDGTRHRVVGVLPPEFSFPFLGITADVWMWMPPDPVTTRRHLAVLARLKNGASWTAASAELDAAARALRADDLWTWRAIPIRADFATRVGTASAFVLGPALVVLLIGCVNVSCMLLARGVERDVELSVRRALGASRARIVRQLIGESLVLAAAGGVLGYVLAAGMLGVISREMAAFRPQAVPALTPDAATFAAAVGVSLLASVLFGTLPAIRTSRRDISSALKGQLPFGTARFVGYHARDLVVFVELALAVVLIVVAGMWLTLFAELQRMAPAFAADEIVAARIHSTDATTAANAVTSVPGVAAVAVGSNLPGARSGAVQLRIPDGRVARAARLEVQPAFFRAIGLPLVSGRAFDASETYAREGTVVVSQRLASTLWPGADPLGARVTISGASGRGDAVVIGVCADALRTGTLAVANIILPDIYVPFDSRSAADAVLVARVNGDAHSYVRPIEAALSAGGRVPAAVTVASDDARLVKGESLFLVRMIAVFGVIALGLAGTGIFAVLSQSVSQRTLEFGVRMAVGATPRRVLLMVITREARLIAAAVATGAAGTLLVTRVVFADLANVSAQDVRMWIGVACLCGGGAAAAAALATRRIVRLDPWTVLRGS